MNNEKPDIRPHLRVYWIIVLALFAAEGILLALELKFFLVLVLPASWLFAMIAFMAEHVRMNNYILKTYPEAKGTFRYGKRFVMYSDYTPDKKDPMLEYFRKRVAVSISACVCCVGGQAGIMCVFLA